MSEVKTNKISSLASNNDITLDPDGTGNTIIASGEVGVGTTTPATYTDYVSGSNAPSVVVAGSQPSYVLADTDISGNDGTLGITKAGEDTVINNLGAGAVRISNNGAERMRVHSEPSSLIRMNTTGAYNSVTSNVPVLHIDVNATSSTPNTGVAVGGLASSEVGFSTMAGSSVDYYSALFHNSGASVVGSIFSTTSSTAFNTSSDYRMKENVVDMTGAITRVKQLAPKRFNFIIAPEKTVDGFLAHEAQVVVPESVTGEKDAVDDNGNAVMQGIDQAKLVPLLVGALQESIAKIEALEARVTALEDA